MAAKGVSQQHMAQWIEKAEHDLATAVHLLQWGAPEAFEAICFHAQQCIEKYIKAVLYSQQRAFPKTHDLTMLMALLPKRDRPSLSAELQETLTDYATTVRYPDDDEPISRSEARIAVAAARRVRREMRRRLPRAALRWRKNQ